MKNAVIFLFCLAFFFNTKQSPVSFTGLPEMKPQTSVLNNAFLIIKKSFRQ